MRTKTRRPSSKKGIVGLLLGLFFSMLTFSIIFVGLKYPINLYLNDIGFGDKYYDNSLDATNIISASILIPIGWFSDKFNKNQTLVQLGFIIMFVGGLLLLFTPRTPLILGFSIMIIGLQLTLVNFYILLHKLLNKRVSKLIIVCLLFELSILFAGFWSGLFNGIIFEFDELHNTIVMSSIVCLIIGFIIFYSFRYSYGYRGRKKIDSTVIVNNDLLDTELIVENHVAEEIYSKQKKEKNEDNTVIVISLSVLFLLNMLYRLMATWNPVEYIDYLNSTNGVSNIIKILFPYTIMIGALIVYIVINLRKNQKPKQLIASLFVGVLFASLSILIANVLDLSGSFLFYMINLGFFGLLALPPILMGTFLSKLPHSRLGLWISLYLFFITILEFLLRKIDSITTPSLSNVTGAILSALLCIIIITYAFQLHKKKFDIKDIF